MPHRPIRLATRAVILKDNRLLLVNAFPDAGQNDANTLWCAPGGGAEPGQSLPENLAREVLEETGLTIRVGAPLLVNEFHNPEDGFHQVDIFFRATITDGALSPAWQDPENIVTRRRFFTQDELTSLRFKPDSLPKLAWQPEDSFAYDPLERLVKP
ncbi:MAG: NUDIX hydrolase [Rhodobacterales bacterium]|nr:MAG: NUDIX hydrolase [Rhodobacterales bacterium]